MSDSAAFGPASLERGALVPAAGRDLMIRSFLLPPGVLDMKDDGWLTPEIPILVRGEVRIIPVAWVGSPDRAFNPDADTNAIKDFARHLLDTGMYHDGPWEQIDLSAEPVDSIGSYAAALRTSGATKADRFVYVEDHLGVVVVWAGDEGAGNRSVAVHIVPESWVFERSAGGPVEGIDVSWSWAKVIDLNRL